MTEYSLKNKGVIFFFYFLIILLGVGSIVSIPKQESPNFPSWNAVIVTRFPGASPLKVEELISEKIEEKMGEITELNEIKSTSQSGVSYVFLAIEESIEEVKPIWDTVREKLGEVQGQLPQGSGTPFLNSDFGKTKSIVLAITGDGFNNRDLVEIAKDLKKDMGQIEYVSRIDLEGEQQEQIILEGSNVKLSNLGISIPMIQQILVEQNLLTPGGEIKVGPQSIRIQPTGEFQTLEDIKNTVITIPGSSNTFLLSDLFRVTKKFINPPTFEMRYMGQDAVALVVEMQDGGQILELGDNIKAFLKSKEEQAYLGIEFHILNFQPKWVQKKINEFTTNLWQAIALVALVMILMLGWREGLIISALIPLTFVITIVVMNFVNIPLHQISIAALIIALGMLVDNGIVMTESISNYVKEGLSTSEASIKTSKELAFPLLTATATTVAAFLPIALAESAVGIFTRSITYVVGIVLLSSFFVAMTMIPVLCDYLLVHPKVEGEPKEKKIGWAGKFYISLMQKTLRFRYLTIMIAVGIFIGVLQLTGFLKFTFFPASDRQQFVVDFYLPEGTDYRETRRQVLLAESHILEEFQDSIQNMAIYIGKGGPRFYSSVSGEQQTPNYAQIVINNHTLDQTHQMIPLLREYLAGNFPDVQAIVKTLDSGPPVGAPIQIQVYGKELDQLYQYAQEVTSALESISGTRDVRDDWGAQIPKISIQINQDQARRVGVSTKDISETLARNFTGSKMTDFRQGDRSLPITLRSTEAERSSLKSLQAINLQTAQGTSVPLLQVAKIGLQWEAGKIKHLNRRRTITIKAYLTGTKTASQVLSETQKMVESIEFPVGYGVNFSGESEKSSKANKSLGEKVPIAVAILVMILVAQFSNVRKMLIILMTIPLSFIGIIIGLILTGYAFGFMAFLGVISLSGIVVNNAILLLEQIEVDIQAGKPAVEAIITAGQRRAFPIILTTITTVGGLVPLAISGEFWGPLAMTITGGLLVSTTLTLVVIPVLYAILFGIKITDTTT
ncbi:MAG: hypothetical protein COB67_04435 [SAR324 cluster bacterium]|uniref:AcrB/AcrD/AcrF family protein n=1 Tax=SAR324 cluster bacterium TaxID=2024889 RepID=A0A2A4T6H2_9DELT|nr:MAG: hypothetical protein COB67_04435 [SAR324 cluster bacterium]